VPPTLAPSFTPPATDPLARLGGAVGRVPFAVAGAGWEVRVAAIAVPDDERVEWLSTRPS